MAKKYSHPDDVFHVILDALARANDDDHEKYDAAVCDIGFRARYRDAVDAAFEFAESVLNANASAEVLAAAILAAAEGGE